MKEIYKTLVCIYESKGMVYATGILIDPCIRSHASTEHKGVHTRMIDADVLPSNL